VPLPLDPFPLRLNICIAIGFTRTNQRRYYQIFLILYFTASFVVFSLLMHWPTRSIYRISIKFIKKFVGCFPKFVLNVLSTNGAESGGTENCDKENFLRA
jgi:hypothetical protein